MSPSLPNFLIPMYSSNPMQIFLVPRSLVTILRDDSSKVFQKLPSILLSKYFFLLTTFTSLEIKRKKERKKIIS